METSVELTLATLAPNQSAWLTEIGGDRSFRRRLMELGLLPGTRITLRKRAPLGDPIELIVRGCSLSIRMREAKAIGIRRDPPTESQVVPVAALATA